MRQPPLPSLFSNPASNSLKAGEEGWMQMRRAGGEGGRERGREGRRERWARRGGVPRP